jgi:hypothetical protein
MCYAQGGAGKSTLGAQAAAWEYKETGKTTRVVNADGGGTRNAHAPLIEAGVVEIWNVDLWDEASTFLNLEKASKGFWPEDVNEPNSPLVAPYYKWKECPACKGDVGARGFNLPKKCANCGAPIAAGTFCPTKLTLTEEFEKIGVIIFEGFTSFGNILMQRLTDVNPEGGRVVLDDKGADKYKITAPGMQHYGNAQTYLAKYVANSKLIPVDLVLWTALENRGDEDEKNVYGPKGPGKALTQACIPWFTDVLHLDAIPEMKGGSIVKDENGLEKISRKLFLEEHYPPDNKLYKFRAKTSATLGGDMPTILDFPATGNTFANFMERLTEAKMKAKEALLG